MSKYATSIDFNAPLPCDLDMLARVPVSSVSRWGDKEWQLDIHAPGGHRASKLIRWEQKLPDDSLLTDQQNSELLETCKRLVWISLSTPLISDRSLDVATVPRVATNLFILIRWMFSNGYRRFRDLDETAIDRYIAYCRTRPGVGGRPLKPGSVHILIIVISYLYILRDHLPDAIWVQPFGGDPASTASGHLASERKPIPYIPEEIAVDIIGKALTWVEKYAVDIIAAKDIFNEEYERVIKSGKCPHAAWANARKRLLRFTPTTSIVTDLPAYPLFRGKEGLDILVGHLLSACFICIAGLVGMRISEIFSLRAGFVEIEPSPDGLIKLFYVRGVTYKTEGDSRGCKTRWVAPPTIKTVENVLERLSAPVRKQTKKQELFLLGMIKRKKTGQQMLSSCMNSAINKFAEFVGVPPFKGKPWRFSSHQFRKTFARFIGKRDKTCLHALAQHFKHVSMAMADYYVGADFELYELVDDALVEETRVALDSILRAESLGGKLGKEILAQNIRFRGRAGEDLRKDYVNFILSETDLVILSHEYAMCVVQLETALCGGDVALMGRSTCVRCPNFIVGDEHAPYWENLKSRNSELLEKLKECPPLMQAPVLAEIRQANEVLLQLSSRRNEDSQEPEQQVGETEEETIPGNC